MTIPYITANIASRVMWAVADIIRCLVIHELVPRTSIEAIDKINFLNWQIRMN